MPVTFEDDPFWTFSLAVYGGAGVAQSCIALQDRHAVDVNVLLFCAWIGASGQGVLTADDFTAILDAAGPWNREVVCRLRAARRWMKRGESRVDPSAVDALRRMITDIEVDCERAEQLALTRSVTRQPADLPADQRVAAIIDNFARYFARMGIEIRDAERADLAAIAGAAMPGVDGEELRKKLARLGEARRGP